MYFLYNRIIEFLLLFIAHSNQLVPLASVSIADVFYPRYKSMFISVPLSNDSVYNTREELQHLNADVRRYCARALFMYVLREVHKRAGRRFLISVVAR